MLQIICEDLIPYYSRHSTEKSVMRYRVADAKIKNNSKSLLDSSFHQPVDSDNFIFYYGVNNIYKIDILSKNCSCRWNMA